jgi:uncharacterized protein (TIGR00251 family)
MPGSEWLKPHTDGVTLTLQIQPNAKTTAVVGLHGGALKVKVRAPPVDGAANAELLAFLAAALGVQARQLSLVRGAAGRQKVILARGVTPEVAAARLAPPSLLG